MSSQASISGQQKVISCPGRTLDPGDRPRVHYTWHDAGLVNIRLSLLRLNDVALAGVSGEVLTGIYAHLKQVSPIKQLIMVTHANGSSGYIPDDKAFAQVSYEITTSPLKPRCA